MVQVQTSSVSIKSYLIPMLALGLMFFTTGFGVGISGMLIPYLQEAFSLSESRSYLVTAAIFSAFVVFGVPSGIITQRIGYKKAMILAFFIMAIGMFLFVPSSTYNSFTFFLLALFVGGIGNTLLQTAINPYITIIGPKESAAMRISLMGIMNKAAWWLGPLFLGLFLNMNNVQISDITTPFYLVTGILCILGVVVFFIPLPDIKEYEKGNSELVKKCNEVSKIKSIWDFPHLLLGVIALFFYVGVETLPMASVIDFAKLAFPSATDYTSFAKYVPLGLVVGYLFGVIMIPKFISQTKALILFTFIAIFSSLALIYLPGRYAIYCFLSLGFANSLMWPAIWPLSIDGLGSYTKKGASLLVMGIVGGAVIPFTFGWILDLIKDGEILSIHEFQKGYWIMIPPYVFILYFALKGHKIRKKFK